MSLEVLVPIAESTAEGLPLAPRVDDLRGKTVGFIHNRWKCLDVIYEVFEDLLHERHGVADVVTKSKRASSPLDDADMEDLVQNCDVVVTGLGN